MANNAVKLFNACTDGDLTSAKEAVNTGINLAYLCPTILEWPLLRACSGSETAERIALVEWILTDPNGASTVNWGHMWGYTSLHIAAGNNNVAIARLLLRAGANPLIRDVSGGTAADWAPVDEDFWDKVESKYMTIIEEWRPWNHSKLPVPFRSAMYTLVLLTKTSVNS